jgi:hypothetical protein
LVRKGTLALEDGNAARARACLVEAREQAAVDGQSDTSQLGQMLRRLEALVARAD